MLKMFVADGCRFYKMESGGPKSGTWTKPSPMCTASRCFVATVPVTPISLRVTTAWSWNAKVNQFNRVKLVPPLGVVLYVSFPCKPASHKCVLLLQKMLLSLWWTMVSQASAMVMFTSQSTMWPTLCVLPIGIKRTLRWCARSSSVGT